MRNRRENGLLLLLLSMHPGVTGRSLEGAERRGWLRRYGGRGRGGRGCVEGKERESKMQLGRKRGTWGVRPLFSL